MAARRRASLTAEAAYSGTVPTYYSDSFMEFVRDSRARRYVLRVRPDGTVRVTMPRWGSRRSAELFADQQRHWIARQRALIARRPGARLVYTPEAVAELRG